MTESNAEPALEHTTARELTREEINVFLARPLIARMATSRDDRPHVVPIWFDWDGEHLWISIDRSSRKYRNLEANPRCAVTIDETEGGLRFKAVVMEGSVELITEPREWALETSRRIYMKYLGGEAILAPTPQEMLRDGDHVIVKLAPERIITWDDTHGVAPMG